jgi:hypothetical protein
MTDSDQLKPDQADADLEIGGPDRPDPAATPGPAAKKRGLRLPGLLAVLTSILIIVILVLMWLTPSDHFLLHFKVKADPLDNLNGWYLIRPEARQETKLFTMAVVKKAEAVYLTSTDSRAFRPTAARADGHFRPGPSETLAGDAQGTADQGSALLMVGCVEGRVMPPTFAFSQLVETERDGHPLPRPPRPCSLRYRVDESDTLNASCIFDGIVASLIQPPGPRDHIQDQGPALLASAGLGRRLTVHLSVDAGRALTAYFDVSQLALARMRLQRECDQD